MNNDDLKNQLKKLKSDQRRQLLDEISDEEISAEVQPKIVDTAVSMLKVFLVVNLLLHLFSMSAVERLYMPGWMWLLIILTALALLYLYRMISKGKNWARWFLLIAFVASIPLMIWAGINPFIQPKYFTFTAGVEALYFLINGLALTFLFSRKSNKWFALVEEKNTAKVEHS